MVRACSTQGRDETSTKFCPISLKDRDNTEYPGIDVRIKLEWILGKVVYNMWIGCI
jgi:hypothetical protein